MQERKNGAGDPESLDRCSPWSRVTWISDGDDLKERLLNRKRFSGGHEFGCPSPPANEFLCVRAVGNSIERVSNGSAHSSPSPPELSHAMLRKITTQANLRAGAMLGI